MTNPYNLELVGAWWAPETANRTNSHGLDAANQAGDTFYRFPIAMLNQPFLRVVKSRKVEHCPGLADYAIMYSGTYPPFETTLSGPLVDLNMFKFIFYGVTSQTDTPSAGLYTRTYINTTARTNPAPTIQILLQFKNVTTAQNMFLLAIGVVIKKAVFDCTNDDDPVTLSLDIAVSKSVAGVELSSPPLLQLDKRYYLGDTVITYTKATVAYAGTVQGFNISINNKPIGRKGGNNKWVYDWVPGYREIDCTLNFCMETKADLEGSDTNGPENADDIDCTIKMQRTATDYLQFAFEKLWDKANQNPDFNIYDFLLGQNQQLIIKSAWNETGGKLTITEVNANATVT